MRNQVRVNRLLVLAAVILLFTPLGTAGAVSAALDQYDPRRDPNYSVQMSEQSPMNWETIWVMVREFEARSPSVYRPQATTPYAQPQPWHYVQGTTPSIASALASDASSYGGWYGNALYPYGATYATWWDSSPRIPWWSLVPFRTNHHRHHRHHEGKAHQH